jgi:hypothetical protein
VALERLGDLARVDLAVGLRTAEYPSVSAVRTCVTTFVPTCTTVTGTRRPLSSHTWVMPSLVPSTAVTARAFCWVVMRFSSFPASELDLDVHVGRQVETMSESTAFGVGAMMSMSRLACASRSARGFLVLVGRPDDDEDVLLRRDGTGPTTVAPARVTVSTILRAELSMTSWS